MVLGRVVRFRDRARAVPVLGRPLVRSGGALRQLPLVVEEILEEVVAPLRRRRRPRHLDAAGDRVATLAGAVRADPAESLFPERPGLGIWSNALGGPGPGRLADHVPAGAGRTSGG